MNVRPRAVVVAAVLAGVVAFCIVQDRVTAAGARRYVVMQRAAFAGRGHPVTIDEVMRPANKQSLWQGLAWGGGVMLIGLVAAGAIAARLQRPGLDSQLPIPNSEGPTPKGTDVTS